MRRQYNDFPKCDTKDTLFDENDDTSMIMHKTLGMSAMHFYMISMTH